MGEPREGFQGFRIPAKRNHLLREVIEKEASNAKKTTLLSLCRTRWVERHEAYEVSFDMLPSIVETLEAISHEQLHMIQNQYSSSPWNWDAESRNKASSLLNAVLRFPSLIAQVTAIKCLLIVKPLSIRLQKRDIDVSTRHTAHFVISKSGLKLAREQIDT